MGLFDNLKRQAENMLKSEIGKAANSVVTSAASSVKSAVSAAAKTKTVTLSSMPQSAEEMRSVPEFNLSDPFAVVAFAVCALNRYESDREASKEMLNALKGPEPLTTREIQFINDRFMDSKGYVTRSYFSGTSPENDYSVSAPYAVTVTEYANSRENEGYIKLYLKSTGADSLRPVTLRHKNSTDEWFLWEFESLLSGVRAPKSTDKWA